MANDPALVVRVGANLDDLRKGLTESQTQIEIFAHTIGEVLGQAIVYAAGKIADFAAALPDIAIHGSEVADLAENFNHLTDQAGLLGDTLMSSLRVATHNTVDDFTLMERVNKNLAAGLKLSEDQYALVAKGAFALSNTMKIDVKEAMDVVNDALITGKAKGLERLTGIIDLEKAEKAYADSLDVTADDLTKQGKLYADQRAILEAVGNQVERLGEQQDGLDEIVAQAHTAWTNFLDDMGEAIATSPVLSEAIAGVRDIFVETFGGHQQELIGLLVETLEDLAIAFIDMGGRAAEVVGTIGAKWHEIIGLFERVQTRVAEISITVDKFFLNVLDWMPKWDSDVRAAITHLQEDMKNANQVIAENKEKIVEHGQAEKWWSDRGKEVHDRFEALKTKLEQTRDATRDSEGAITKAGEAHGATAGRVRDHSAALDENVAHVKTNTKAQEEADKILDNLHKQTYKNQLDLYKDMAAEQARTLKQRNAEELQAFQTVADAQKRLSDFQKSQTQASADDQILKIWQVVDEQEKAFKGSEAQRAQYNQAVETLALEQAQAIIDQENRATQAANAEVQKRVETQRRATDEIKGMFGELNTATGSLGDLSGAATAANTDPLIKAYLASGFSLTQAMAMAAGHGVNVGARVGTFAAGGPVSGGEAILVGERGPELFVPPSSGAIVPNAGGTSITNHIYVTQPLGTPQAIASAVNAAQMSTMRGRGERFRPPGV